VLFDIDRDNLSPGHTVVNLLFFQHIYLSVYRIFPALVAEPAGTSRTASVPCRNNEQK
jgi:hypothetical protein